MAAMKRTLFALLLTLGAHLRADPIVLAVSYTSSDPILHIGSVMTVYMSAMQPTATLSVSVTTASVGQLTVGGADLASLVVGTTVTLTDGIHAWRAPVVAGGTVTVSNASLVGGPGIPAMQVADYSTLINFSFRAYTGNLINNLTAGASEYVDLGSFDSVVLNDQGGNGDALAGDGLWAGSYFVRALGFTITNGHLFGNVSVSNVLATNAPFQGSTTFNLDGIRPSIDHVQWSTNDPNYSDMLYLSSLCQNTSTPQPTNGFGRFDVTTNKTGVNVQITIHTPTQKPLPPIVIPSGAVSPTGFRVWDGTDGSSPNPVFVQDGTYLATLFAYDNYGVPALTTATALITVISMRMVIDNINVSPSVVVLDPATNKATQDVSTGYTITLKNDSNTSIAPSLSLLGFGPGPYSSPASVASTVGSQSTVNFINADGSLGFSAPTGDVYPLSDTDANMFSWFAFGGAPIGPYPKCYLGLPGGSTNLGTQYWEADGNLTNDEDGYMGITCTGPPGACPPNYFYQPFSASAPTTLSTRKGFVTSITANGPLSFRIQLEENLATFASVIELDPPMAPNVPDPCTPSSGVTYTSGLLHFQSSRVGLRAVDSSVVISAQSTAPLVLDTTPPLVTSSDPQDGAIILPNVYGGAGKVLTVNVNDPETGINASTSSLELIDPTGALVGGVASNSGGAGTSSILYFTPNSTLAMGGSYILRVKACNGSSLCLSKDIHFTIKDTASPDVYSVDLVSANQTQPIPLTLNQSVPDGPFDTITQVSVTLSMANSSTNVIDGDNSVVALESISGTGTPVDVPITRVSPLKGQTPANSRNLTLLYSIDSPIVGAGKFQVVVTSYSKDASGNSYSGPANFTPPKFFTQANPLALNITYPDGFLAVTGLLPVTMTVGATNYAVNNGFPAARAPGYALLPTNTGFTPLVPADADAGLQWVVSGVPLLQAPTFKYPITAPLRVTLYYNDWDLPAGVTSANLSLFAYTGIAWRQLSTAEYTGTFTNVTRNTMVITLPNAPAPSDSIYGIFYPASVTSTVGTPTPAVFLNTRSFNPVSGNVLNNRAKFYYGNKAPQSMDARIYDTAGRLVKTLTLGKGITLADVSFGEYFFLWDGTNDSGTIVRNGIYLVRWQVSTAGGGSDTETKAVALIK
jgi:hypothetical protein